MSASAATRRAYAWRTAIQDLDPDFKRMTLACLTSAGLAPAERLAGGGFAVPAREPAALQEVPEAAAGGDTDFLMVTLRWNEPSFTRNEVARAGSSLRIERINGQPRLEQLLQMVFDGLSMIPASP